MGRPSEENKEIKRFKSTGFDCAKPCDYNRTSNEGFTTTVRSLIAAFYVFYDHTVTYESLLVMLMSAGSACFYLYFLTPDMKEHLAVKLDFSILSVAVVFPLTFLIGQSFSRREQALNVFAEFKAILMNISMAFFNWNFPSIVDGKYSGRDLLPEDFEQVALQNALMLLNEINLFLSLPNVTRAKHLVFGGKGNSRIKEKADKSIKKMAELVDRSYYLVEIMKERGLPANAASRINQYHWFLQARIERLRNFKWYRTPQATRSFGRVYIFILPWFYGPYYAWVAGREVSTTFELPSSTPIQTRIDSATNAAFAICLSLLTSLVLIGLINVQRLLEDPFLDVGIDVIHVEEDIALSESCIVQQYNLSQKRKRKRVEYKNEKGELQYTVKNVF